MLDYGPRYELRAPFLTGGTDAWAVVAFQGFSSHSTGRNWSGRVRAIARSRSRSGRPVVDVPRYLNVEMLRLHANVREGAFIETLGFYAPGDGGGAV